MSAKCRKEPTTNGASGYDIRAAAPSYVTVIGAVGGFAVAVVVLLLSEDKLPTPARHAAGVSVDLFMISLVGSVMAAFALGAISGEKELNARVAAAGLIANSGQLLASLLCSRASPRSPTSTKAPRSSS